MLSTSVQVGFLEGEVCLDAREAPFTDMLLYFIFSRDKSDMAPLCRRVDPALQSSLNRYQLFVLHVYYPKST